jgi:soluble cytochrome b562
MNGFHHRLDASISKDLTRTMQIGNPCSLEDLRDHRDILPVVRAGMKNMTAELDKAEAEADEAHKKLKQLADLKAVYDIAYQRMVTGPAKVFRELDPMVESMLPAIEELGAYLDEHRNVIEFRGGAPATKGAAVRNKLNTLMQAAAKAAEASEEGKRKLRAMAEGR